ncbi:MAG TPA: branched-chain-amino-acid transaminase [Thermodesulfovibrionales bacterium]|nr:branched-chain-amino-acid transaminase [Thermodesulfovibrionales bacterium]
MFVYLNDRLVPKAEARVSVFDHGFLYGDGIYETVRAYDDVIFLLDEHLMRLYRSASMIGLTMPKDADEMKTAIYETLEANALKNAYIRITLSRGYGPIGLDPELCKEPTFVIIAEEMKGYPRSLYEHGIRLIIAGTRRNLSDALNPQLKSLNFLNNILAKIEAKNHGAYEAVMLNVSGHVTEGTISNIFFFRDGVLRTPSLGCGILDGITRKVVLDLAVREGMAVEEGEFTREDLYAAGEVFITNTTMEVMPVCQLDDVKYAIGDKARHLRKSYRDEVRAYVISLKGSGPSLWEYE